MVVSRLGVPVYDFDGTPGGISPINLYSGQDNSIVIALEQARRSKRLALYMPSPQGLSTNKSWTDFNDILFELYRIKELTTHFFLSFAVQKNSSGKKVEMLVLQDEAASLSKIETNPPKAVGRVRFDFALKAPTVKAVSLDK